MDWARWATFGLAATAGLTAVMISAQLAGWSRMDIPMMLGTIFVHNPDRARVVGAAVHLLNGQAFGLGYGIAFALLDTSSWWLGALFGLGHGLIALTLIVPLLPGVHQRMGSSRSGTHLPAALEPPGLLALNYGPQTPVVTLMAHVVYGAVLGMFLR